MKNRFPPDWTSTTLSELVAAKKGKKPAVLRKNPAVGFVPYLDIKAIEKKEVRQFAEVKSSRLASEKDLFVVWDGARSGWIGTGMAGAIGSTIMALTPRQGNPEYLRYFIASHFQTINTRTRGTGIPHVDPEVFWNLEVPLPPLSVQRRIVAKLEKLLAKMDSSQLGLARIPVLLKRFRQSILAAACSGRLTTDWRKQSTMANGQPSPIADVDLPDIPDSWRWVKLPDTGEMNRGKSRHRPRNEPALFGGPYPFIQTGDIAQSGGRITAHKQTYSKAGLAQSRLWPAGTICITIAANIAESAILTYPACFPDSVVGIMANPNACMAEYVEYFIRVAKADLATFAPATAQKNINIAILNELSVPLPPLAEQKEIIRRVEKLFALADQIEARCTLAKAHAGNLTQSILARAFRGTLIRSDKPCLS